MTAEFMLDTDSVSWALRGQGAVAGHLLEHRPSQVCISSVTLAELRFAAEASALARRGQPIGTFDDVAQPRRPLELHRELVDDEVVAVAVPVLDRPSPGPDVLRRSGDEIVDEVRLDQRVGEHDVSTLRNYVEATGGKLSLVAEFPDHAPVILTGIAVLD